MTAVQEIPEQQIAEMVPAAPQLPSEVGPTAEYIRDHQHQLSGVLQGIVAAGEGIDHALGVALGNAKAALEASPQALVAGTERAELVQQATFDTIDLLTTRTGRLFVSLRVANAFEQGALAGIQRLHDAEEIRLANDLSARLESIRQADQANRAGLTETRRTEAAGYVELEDRLQGHQLAIQAVDIKYHPLQEYLVSNRGEVNTALAAMDRADANITLGEKRLRNARDDLDKGLIEDFIEKNRREYRVTKEAFAQLNEQAQPAKTQDAETRQEVAGIIHSAFSTIPTEFRDAVNDAISAKKQEFQDAQRSGDQDKIEQLQAFLLEGLDDAATKTDGETSDTWTNQQYVDNEVRLLLLGTEIADVQHIQPEQASAIIKFAARMFAVRQVVIGNMNTNSLERFNEKTDAAAVDAQSQRDFANDRHQTLLRELEQQTATQKAGRSFEYGKLRESILADVEELMARKNEIVDKTGGVFLTAAQKAALAEKVRIFNKVAGLIHKDADAYQERQREWLPVFEQLAQINMPQPEGKDASKAVQDDSDLGLDTLLRRLSEVGIDGLGRLVVGHYEVLRQEYIHAESSAASQAGLEDAELGKKITLNAAQATDFLWSLEQADGAGTASFELIREVLQRDYDQLITAPETEDPIDVLGRNAAVLTEAEMAERRQRDADILVEAAFRRLGLTDQLAGMPQRANVVARALRGVLVWLGMTPGKFGASLQDVDKGAIARQVAKEIQDQNVKQITA